MNQQYDLSGLGISREAQNDAQCEQDHVERYGPARADQCWLHTNWGKSVLNKYYKGPYVPHPNDTIEIDPEFIVEVPNMYERN